MCRIALIRLLMLGSAMLVTACNGESPAVRLPSPEYVGCYLFGFEAGFFAQAPVHSDTELWFVVSAPDTFLDSVEDMYRPEHHAEIFLRVRADVGPEGPHGYGHMGLAKREMHIREVLEFRDNMDSDGPCFPPPPSQPSSSGGANYALERAVTGWRVGAARAWESLARAAPGRRLARPAQRGR